ncbi:type VI secretion system Vgr family protein [Sorangium sp. So ce131]|uniref:type VI secretion system Vgr family protein n=1 Tax=Sorangium sp. So ce131 TaxID=3133282 RepID=UPI003F5F217B
MAKDYAFAWEGANHPDGPWHHLRVVEFRGREAMSELYAFEIELLRLPDAPDVDVADLVGRAAALRIETSTTPASRVVHGIIASAEELGELHEGTRYRVALAPPLLRATMMKKSIIYLEKTLQQIVEQVLSRASWGAGLEPSSGDGEQDGGDLGRFQPARQTFAWRVVDMSRIADPEARPYCVQYEESDFAFVSRLLEEEGISYHFEHTAGECTLVLSDFDGGRALIDPTSPLGPGILGREVRDVRVGARVRPKSASLNDYSWRRPQLDLVAVSPAGVTDFQTHEHPGRYEHSKELGERLAEKRQQRLDTEREWAAASASCRLLGAGSVFQLDHSNSKWSGRYLVTAIEHVGHERESFAARGAEEEPYAAHFEAIRCGAKGQDGDSNFRPERRTPRPRIVGSQTAVVTADPSSAGAEIHLGGPEDIGCVRLKFHWDLDSGRLEKEPSSCWVRVSQLFAGAAGHGALWHPRVGNEVIVDFLDGDPDRPIVTGRVYNGANLPPENPTRRPTYSAIKSYTSPFDGNFNMLAFEDAAGKEQIVLHAARDLDETVKRNASRAVGVDDATQVGGNQSVQVTGSQSTSAGSVSVSSGSTVMITAASDLSAIAQGGLLTASAGTNLIASAGTNVVVGAGSEAQVVGGSRVTVGAPVVDVNGAGNVNVDAPWIDIKGGAKVRAGAAIVEVNGVTVLINGSGSIAITGGTVTVSGTTVNVKGSGTVNVNGGVVNLNC